MPSYFLHPQIHWRPKSTSVGAIAEALNIGVDTLMFVDDQPFERREVSSAWPQVRVVDANEFAGIFRARPEPRWSVTEESRSRRLMYRAGGTTRVPFSSAYEGNYLTFLKESGYPRRVGPASNESSLQRVYELAQRTNQMNFSGNRYSLGSAPAHDGRRRPGDVCPAVLGSFRRLRHRRLCVVRLQAVRLLDLMFSCRVQSKRVEHAFLAWLLRKYLRDGTGDFLANLRKTPKNAPSSRGVRRDGIRGGGDREWLTTLRFQTDQPISDDGIVSISVADQ